MWVMSVMICYDGYNTPCKSYRELKTRGYFEELKTTIKMVELSGEGVKVWRSTDGHAGWQLAGGEGLEIEAGGLRVVALGCGIEDISAACYIVSATA